MNKKRVAVILTGELRYIDYCYKWWKNVIENSDYDVTLYSSTWNTYSDSIAICSKVKEEFEYKFESEGGLVAAVNSLCPDVSAITTPDTYLTNRYAYPKPILNHTDGPNYFFGRTIHLHRAMTVWVSELSEFDIIVHGRWDTAFRDTNEWNIFIGNCSESISFRHVEIDYGNVYACDFAYGGPSTEMTEIYSDVDIIQKHIDVFNEKYTKSPTAATTFLIGHNLYSSYIASQLKSIRSVEHECTLVRKHDYDFEYTIGQWNKLNDLFLLTMIPPGMNLKRAESLEKADSLT